MSVTLGGFENQTTYVGTLRDKAQGWRYRRRGFSSVWLDDFADAYTHDDVVHAVATRTPEEMLSRGYEIWQGLERRKDLERALGPEGLNLEQNLLQALTWERLVSGGALLIGAEDGRPLSAPLHEPSVSRVFFAPDLERRDILGNVQRDPVLRVMFLKGTLDVHRSRLILFKGAAAPRREANIRQGWGVGAVEYAWTEIAAFHAAWKEYRALTPDGNQSVFKISGLVNMLANETGRKNLRERIQTIEQHRSIVRGIVLDKDGENFERVSTNLTGYSDAVVRAFERLAMAVGEPLTILVGTPPKGLNATGESDLTIYYDRVARKRKPAERAILKIARLEAIAQRTSPEGLRIEWPPFWQPSEAESADVTAKKAATAKLSIENGQAALAVGAITEGELRGIVRAALELEG